LDLVKAVEKYNKDTKILKEKLTKTEQEYEAEKVMLNEEKKKSEEKESRTMEMMRNLM
jgi:tetrahydromethanopterin S-methyltransferase subunit A